MVPDVFDIYFDPRIEFEADRRSIVENKDDVSYVDLLAQNDVFNLKEVKDMLGRPYSMDGGNHKLNKFNTEGIPTVEDNKQGINIKMFHGYFSEKDKPED